MIQLDGWYCTNEIPEGRQCGTWNGTEKDRKECRSCGGPKTAPEGLTREDLFRLCALMVRERNAAVENVTAMQAKLARYIECAQAAKAFVDSPGRSLIAALVAVIERLEEDPMTAAAMKRPYEPPKLTPLGNAPRCSRCFGTKLVTAGGVSADCPECAAPTSPPAP